VKTTLEIPDELFRRAKALAASRGVTLKQLVTEAIEERVKRGAPRGSRPAWRALAGQLASLHCETLKIDRWVQDEFERLDEDED
jgi:hypothetical protein